MGRNERDGRDSDVSRLIRGDHLVEPPDGTVRRAVALGERLGRSKDGWVRWVVERLYDSAAMPAPAGVRGGAGERRLLFEMHPMRPEDAHQLDLRIRRENRGTRRVTGQLLPPIENARVAVGRKTVEVASSGEFAVGGLPARGGLDLEILVPGGDPIRVPDLDGEAGPDPDDSGAR